MRGMGAFRHLAWRSGHRDLHLTQCPKQEIPCPYCSWEAEQIMEEGSHRDECPEISVPRPNTCLEIDEISVLVPTCAPRRELTAPIVV